MILLPEDLEDLWHLSRLPDRLHRSDLPDRLHRSDLPVPAAPFHPEGLLRLLRRPDMWALRGLEGRSRPEDQRRLSHRSDLQDPEDLQDLSHLSLPEDPEDLLHPSDLQAR